MKKIDEELGVVEHAPKEITPFIPPLTNEDDIENDYKYQRENFYNLVERGSDAIEGILELAKEGDLLIKQNKLFEDVYIKEK